MSALSDLQATLDPSRKSWVESANDSASDFSIQNLPFGIFSDDVNATRRVGVAIGDRIVDLAVLEQAGSARHRRRFRHAAPERFHRARP